MNSTILSLICFIQSHAAAKRDDETGATAVEYGMLVALIAAVIVATVVVLGETINNAFSAVTDALTDAIPGV